MSQPQANGKKGAAQRGEPQSLHQSKARLAAIFAQAALGLSEISLDGRFRHVNDELCRILGRSRSDLLSSAVPDVTHADDLPQTLSAFQRLVETGVAASLDKRYVRPDGSVVYANSALTRLDDDDGAPYAVLAVTADLTERKRREFNAAFLAKIQAETTPLSGSDQIMRHAGKMIVRQLAVSSVTFAEITDDATELLVLCHYSGDDHGSDTPTDECLTKFLRHSALANANGNHSVAMNDIRETSAAVSLEASQPCDGIRSQIYAPSVSEGGWRLLLAVHHNQPREWRTDEIELVRELSARLCLGLERARAEEARHALHLQLETELSDMRRLQKTSTRLIAKENPHILFQEILDTGIAFSHADTGVIQVYEPGPNELRLLASRGLSQEVQDELQRLGTRGNSSCALAIRDGKRVILPKPTEHGKAADPTLDKFHRQAGLVAAQSTPLISRSGALLGVLSTHWRHPRVPAKRELRLLDLLARQAADLIERHQAEAALRKSEQELRELSRTLEERVKARTTELQEQTVRLRHLAVELASTEQRERKRLAALLHDDLQQLLVAATMGLRTVIRHAENPTCLRAAEETANWVREAADSARDLTRELRPPTIYEDGLVSALNWLSSEFQKRYNLQVDLSAQPNSARSLNDDIKALLFDCVRELLFNVAKHARVKQAALFLEECSGSIHAVVSDSGAGFDVKRVWEHRSTDTFGLFSIRERLAALGGKMRIESTPGRGTRVQLTLDRASIH